MLERQAKLKGAVIVAGINEREGEKLYNTAVLVDASGVIGKYRKIHLFVDEKDFFMPGDLGLPVFQIKGYKVGIQICFDYLFADAWRLLAMKGADIICHPSNLITENAYRTLPGQALMNQVYIATANRTGTEYELAFCGKSAVYGPSGEIMMMLGREEEAVGFINLDLSLARNKMITSRNHVFDDLRPEAYF
jgi:predicted amidohydrolase